LRLAELAKPVPTDNEVLIKVRAASVNAFDLHFVQGKPLPIRLLFGLRRPKNRPGRDVAGQVEAVGSKVTQFKPGDEVFGVCPGAFAEYACAAEDKLALKPASVSFENAATLPIAAITALQGLRAWAVSSRTKKSWWMALRAAWAHLPSRLPNRSELKSLPCAAPARWIRRDRSAPTM